MSDKFRFGCLIGLLFVCTINLRWLDHSHPVPARTDFDSFPTQLAGWTGKDLSDFTPGTKRVLAADNYLLRDYRNSATGEQIDLFIVYYRSQRSGDALHSPKNCLPGAGWNPVSSQTVRISNPAVPGTDFEANHYVIEKDGAQQDVLYWYQAHGRTFASEYLGKIYLAWDGITKGRTDGALIRITAPRTPQTFPAMVGFAQAVAPVLPQFLPN
ncbi:MAG: exosortase C-terminal domain/associated protein EpsI [Candidatus Acidiferrales bacterium]